MKIIADLQLHSKYSRAVSPQMVLPTMSKLAKIKGIDLLATGDWMHPLWMKEVSLGLKQSSKGIYQSKENPKGAKFLLSAEISNIYSQGGKGRRVHNLVFSPNIDTCLKINKELTRKGCNLSSDGRPIVGISSIDLAQIVFSINEKCLIIPAHAWTPWFALYGSKSGFDSIKDAFGKFASKIFAIETGLSSDPAMNWKIEELSKRAILSFSDAHSPAKIGREATVFTTIKKTPNFTYTYDDIYWAIAERFLGKNKGNLKIDSTIEFYPQEGKYHWDGHRKCNLIHSPSDTKKKGIICPVCIKPLTVGVEYRINQLSSGSLKNITPIKKKSNNNLVYYHHPTDSSRPPYIMLVPLLEILSEVIGFGINSKAVKNEYDRLISLFSSEFNILINLSIDKINSAGGSRLAQAIKKVRSGDISITPGYDGVFGAVKIWPQKTNQSIKKQMDIFNL